MREIKLFCIPYAGGTAELFDEFCSFLPKEIEAVKIEYSGHGRRRKEPYYKTFNEMVEDVAHLVNDNINENKEIALFGYSMGSIVAYELMAQKLLSKKPIAVMLAAHEAPDYEWDSKKYCLSNDADFLKLIQDMGGFEGCNEEMLSNKFFKKLYFNPVRADYNLIGDYKMSKRIELDVPALMFYSPKDIPPSHMKEWEPFLGKYGQIIEIGENHFFIRKYAKELADRLSDILE